MEGLGNEWMVLYTRPRAEKRVVERLKLREYEVYLPLRYEIRQWSDRKKKVLVPVVSSYVFVKCQEKDRNEILNVQGVMCFMFWQGKPARVPDSDIVRMRAFLNDFEYVEAKKIDLQIGDQYEISKGGFMGHKGELIRIGKNKVCLRLNSIGFDLIATVHKSAVTS